MEHSDEKPTHVFVDYAPPAKKAGEYTRNEIRDFLGYVLDQTDGEDGQLRDSILKAIGIHRSTFNDWMKSVGC